MNHRLGLAFVKKFGFDKTAQAEFGAQFFLKRGNAVHEFDHAGTDIKFVVVKHEARVAVSAVHRFHFLQDIIHGARADGAKHRGLAAAAKAAFKRTAELTDQAEGAMIFNRVVITGDVHQMPGGKWERIQFLVT